MSASGGMRHARFYSERMIDSAYGAEDTQGMTLQTHVSIYSVDETGATGAQVGSGTLIGPVLVLVHPPLSRRLAGGENSMRLRVGIAPAGPPPNTVDFIDSSDIHVATDDNREPLVALELLQPTAAPIESLFPAGDSDGFAADALAQHLASLPESDRISGRALSGSPRRAPAKRDSRKRSRESPLLPPWCRIWPDGPGCR